VRGAQAALCGVRCKVVGMSDVHLREATLKDAGAMAAIYQAYVLTSAATMELEPPDEAEIGRRIGEVRAQGLPCLVAEENGEVIGYGYAAPFRPRPGYRFTLEDSIYLRNDRMGRGVGRKLLAAVIDGSREAGCKQMVAVIGGDNPASVTMHRAMGFALVGVMQGVGWKFDRAQNVTIMQLTL
jgi:L-amino acid N-acyltransferase YncA